MIWLDYIQVASDVACVATNGAQISPFDSLAKAATNIQQAVDTVVSGGRVVVGDGHQRRARYPRRAGFRVGVVQRIWRRESGRFPGAQAPDH